METTNRVHLLNASVRKRYGDKYDRWELACDCFFAINNVQYVIKQGFITDFASIPWWCPNWLIPRSGLSALPALAHDFMYEHSGISRTLADKAFHALLKEAGVAFWQRNLMYNYVVMLGWIRFVKS